MYPLRALAPLDTPFWNLNIKVYYDKVRILSCYFEITNYIFQNQIPAQNKSNKFADCHVNVHIS